MKIKPDTVYLYRVPITTNHAPFATYRELAHAALRLLEPDLPTGGTMLLKPSATVLFPADRRVITHPAFLAGMIDALVEKGVPRQRLVMAEGQAGEQPKHGHTWEKRGYRAMLAQQQVRPAVLAQVEARQVAVPGGVVHTHYPIAREVTDWCFFFNAPVAKCHNLVCTTLAMKKLMGTLATPERHICSVQQVDEGIGEERWRLETNGLSVHENRFLDKLCDLLAAHRSLGLPRRHRLQRGPQLPAGLDPAGGEPGRSRCGGHQPHRRHRGGPSAHRQIPDPGRDPGAAPRRARVLPALPSRRLGSVLEPRRGEQVAPTRRPRSYLPGGSPGSGSGLNPGGGPVLSMAAPLASNNGMMGPFPRISSSR